MSVLRAMAIALLTLFLAPTPSAFTIFTVNCQPCPRMVPPSRNNAICRFKPLFNAKPQLPAPITRTSDEEQSSIPKEINSQSSVDVATSTQQHARDKAFDLFSSPDALGVAVLATVPVVWGSYVPVVRGLYEIDPPIPGFIFSAAYFLVASVSMFSILVLSNNSKSNPKTGSSSVIRWTSFVAGAELGSYLFIGNSLQVLGLKTVPSSRAGFLVQLTTILVPLLQAALSRNASIISSQTWIACVLALLGVSVMEVSSETMKIPSLWENPLAIDLALLVPTSGDCLILAAAFVYSLHVVRLGRWANATDAIQLVAYKATTELVLSLVLISVLVGLSNVMDSPIELPDSAAFNGPVSDNMLINFCRDSGSEIVSFFETVNERMQNGMIPRETILKAAGATVWTGLVSTAYTTYAQSYGQRRVSPANANLIYSLQPIFTTIFAYVLLGETMDSSGFVGGALIGGAVYLSASQAFSNTNDEEREDD